jgi:hypothetical protein
MAMAGAEGYFWVFTVVLVLAGQPAFTATSFAFSCGVLALEFDPVLLVLPPDTRKTIPTITPTMTTMMMLFRICLRRFWL